MVLDPAAVARDAGELGLDLAPEQAARFVRFAELLQRWSAVHNLTAIASDSAILSHHLLDSLSIAPVVRSLVDGGLARVLDVGSGGGLPGIPLAVALPRVHLTAVDKVAKKVAFLTQARVELGLDNFDAVHARVESWQAARQYDVIVARAFSTIADLVRLTRRLIAPRGAWLAMKGRRPDDELAALARGDDGVYVERVVKLRVPRLSAERHLIIARLVAA